MYVSYFDFIHKSYVLNAWISDISHWNDDMSGVWLNSYIRRDIFIILCPRVSKIIPLWYDSELLQSIEEVCVTIVGIAWQ